MAKFRKTDKEKFQNSSNAVGIAETREPRSGEDFHKMWLSRIDTAIRTRELHQDGINVWNRMYNLYKGDHWPTEDDEPIFLNSDEPRVKITVNKCKSVVKNTLAFILQSNPKFIANPKRAEDVNSAKIQAEWLNVLWDELDINSIIEDVLRDWLIIGMGVAKTGFRYQKDSRVMSVKLDGTINYSDYMIDEQPFVYRVNPKMFLWDFNEQFDNSRWCCEVLFKPKTDVYANKNYSQKALNMIRTGMQSPISVASFTQSTRENYKALGIEESHTDDEERLVIYEIWDKKYRQHLVYLAGVTEPLIDEVWPYDYLLDDNEGFPYEVIFFDPIPNEPFAQGIIKAFEDQQYEKNRNRTAGFGHRRRFNRKYAVVEDSVSPQDIDMLANGGDGAIIKVKSAGDIQPIQDAPLSSDHYNQEQIIDNDIAELTGADALFTGGRLPSRTSAQEINARGNVQSTKLSLPINRADKFCVNIGYKTLSHSRANVTGVQAIRILGSLANTWEQFQTSTLSSRITLKLEYSTSKPYNSDMDKQQRMGVFQMLTNVFPLLQQTQVQVNFGELLKWTLEPFDIKDVARFLPGNAMINPVPPWQVIPSNNGQSGQQPMNPQNMPMGLPSTPNPMASQMGQQGASGNAQSQNMGSLLGGS